MLWLSVRTPAWQLKPDFSCRSAGASPFHFILWSTEKIQGSALILRRFLPVVCSGCRHALRSVALQMPDSSAVQRLHPDRWCPVLPPHAAEVSQIIPAGRETAAQWQEGAPCGTLSSLAAAFWLLLLVGFIIFHRKQKQNFLNTLETVILLDVFPPLEFQECNHK